jgi:hypothetical protein
VADGLWFPDNLVERELAWALTGADFARFFQVFLQAQLWVPVRAVSGEQDERWDPVTREVLGETVVPVFTSDTGLLAVMGDETAELYVSEWDQLQVTWPDPAWRLAINPGLPIQAYLPIDRVAAAAGDELLPGTDSSVLVQSLDEGHWTPWPPGGPEQAMREWAEIGDGAEYLAALLSCMVFMPTTRVVSPEEVAEAHRRSLLGGEPARLPLRTVGPPDMLEVFTNQELFDRVYPESPSIHRIFQSLFWVLPSGCGLSVNPRGPAGLDLRGEDVPLLAGWGTLDPIPSPVMRGMRWAREALESAGE